MTDHDQKELGSDYPVLEAGDRRAPLSLWYAEHKDDTAEFEEHMRRKVHYVIEPAHLWSSIAELGKRPTAPPTIQRSHRTNLSLF